MGKNTWLSLPLKPLPKRENWVISQNFEDKRADKILTINQFEKIIQQKKQEFMIIGGAKLLNHYQNHCQRMYISLIEKNYQGDTFFYLKSSFLDKFDKNYEQKITTKKGVNCRFMVFEKK